LGLLGGIIGGITSLIGGSKSSKAAKQAAQLQYNAAQQGIAEERRQFDITRSDHAPYMAAGREALARMGALLGLEGDTAQDAEIAALRDSPLYKSLYRSGEEAVLANASATGGLRGGNTVRSLADFGEDTLAALIERQLSGYGGLVGVGSGATDAVSNFGANAVAAMNNLRQQGAAAQAQSALVRGGIASQNWQNLGSILSDAVGGFDWKKLF
jgi:hypothetical protein